MKDAFGTRESQKVRNLCAVFGAAAGFTAAARLAPVRATRLAAHSVAAVSGRDPPAVDVDSTPEQEGATIGSTDHSATELESLKLQVKTDFQSIRNDISTAFNCIIQPESEEEEQEQQPKPKTLKKVIPAAASSVVGVTVAAWLVPLRVARFAVANLASASASLSEAERANVQETTISQEPEAAPQSSAPDRAGS